MALIKCPECGKEGVSDCAESCPGCGYNIKAHFKRIKEEEQNKKREEALKKEKEQREQEIKRKNEKQIECPECRKKILEKLSVCPYCGLSFDDKENLNRLYDIQSMEEMLNDKSAELKFGLEFLFFAGMSILCFVFYSLDSDGLSLIFALFMGVVACILLIVLIMMIDERSSLKQKLELARTDYEKYKEEERKRRAKSIASLNRMEEEKARKDAINHPACPMCGSKKTMKISTVNRAASVAMVGVASSKIGKQYQCKSCGYKW